MTAREIQCTSPLSGEHLGVNQSGGYHHLHSQEEVHHVGRQSRRKGLRANEVETTGGRHLPSLHSLFLTSLTGLSADTRQ